VGGIVKKGVGLVQKVVCSSGGGGASGLAKTLAGAAAAAATFDLAAHWIIGAASKITGAIVAVITHSSSPQLTAGWFKQAFEPLAALGAVLALLVTLIAFTSAAVRRNPAALAATISGVVRAGLGTGLLIALTTVALQISDAISSDVIRSSHETFWSQVGGAWGSSGFGGFGSSALAMLMAVIQIVAGVIVWLELAVRNAAICIAVLFFPVALAASIWPALGGWSTRLGRLLFLFVILKPVTVIVLAFAGDAALAGLSLNGTLGSSAGTIIAAITIFALAALAPWALMLIVGADAESAAMGAGFRAAAGHAMSDGARMPGRLGGRLRNGRTRGGSSFGAGTGGLLPSARGAGRGRGPRGSGGAGGGGRRGGPGPVPPGGGAPSSPEPVGSSKSSDASAGSGSPGVSGHGSRGAAAGSDSPAAGAVAVAAGLGGGRTRRADSSPVPRPPGADGQPPASGGTTRMPAPSKRDASGKRGATASPGTASEALATEPTMPAPARPPDVRQPARPQPKSRRSR
jgi:hypothetical protein